jgi:hypothetical protein
MTHEPGDTLSQEAVLELSQDHLEIDPPDSHAAPISFDDEEPASVVTPLGTATMAIADEFLKMPLREDAGVNNDQHGHIKKFFTEGLRWSAETWDRWAEKYPKTGVNKPEWCAAFASYCARQAYTGAGLKLPATPSGSASEMVKRFSAVNRLLRREDLFNEDGCLKEGVTPPGPGDLVIWKGHVGLLKDIYPSGAFTTIEGNTWRGKVRSDGVYRCSRSSLEKRGDGTYKLVGFCILGSKDGQAKASSD